MTEDKPTPSPEPPSQRPQGPVSDASPFPKPPLDVVEKGQDPAGVERRDHDR
jgi:hypothetical protein